MRVIIIFGYSCFVLFLIALWGGMWYFCFVFKNSTPVINVINTESNHILDKEIDNTNTKQYLTSTPIFAFFQSSTFTQRINIFFAFYTSYENDCTLRHYPPVHLYHILNVCNKTRLSPSKLKHRKLLEKKEQ